MNQETTTGQESGGVTIMPGMSDEPSVWSQDSTGSRDSGRMPVMQRIMDNPFMLLFIGVVVPTVFYIIWGIMELITIPLAR